MADIIETLCEVELDVHPELPKQKIRIDMVFVNGEEFDKALDEYYEKHPDITVERMDEFETSIMAEAKRQIEEQLTEKLLKFKEAKIDA